MTFSRGIGGKFEFYIKGILFWLYKLLHCGATTGISTGRITGWIYGTFTGG